MKTIMAKSFQDLSSKKQFHWTSKVSNEEQQQQEQEHVAALQSEQVKTDNLKFHPLKGSTTQIPSSTTLNTIHENKTVDSSNNNNDSQLKKQEPSAATRRKLQTVAVARLKSVLLALGRNKASLQQGLGTKVVGTLFGQRRGHVHFAFQKDSGSQPAFLVELATPISGLVREMASGLVRIALECDKEEENKKVARLIDEPVWRTYCNGKKCGFATRRECGPKELQILKAVEPISMGAGVLPAGDGEEGDSSCEIMYMRARFERVIGSRDSEAFYMMNPDSNAAPELSIYLLRV